MGKKGKYSRKREYKTYLYDVISELRFSNCFSSFSSFDLNLSAYTKSINELDQQPLLKKRITC